LSVLVTGGAGRLGYQVIKLLSEEGYSSRAFDLPGVNWEPLEQIRSVSMHKGDITNPISVEKSLKGVESIVHLAALLPPVSERDGDHTYSVNVGGTQNLISASGVDVKIVLASSISVYGVTSEESPPIREDHELVPHNNYSRSKILAEQTVKESRERHTILRVAPISMVDLIELPETIPYRGDQRVEFVLDEDAAKAFVNSLEEGNSEIYNISGGETWQMRGEEYIKRFYDSLGVEVEPNFSEDYTAVDWYSTEKSKVFDYQRTSFMQFEERLEALGREMGLR